MKSKFETYKELLGEKITEIYDICSDNDIPFKAFFDVTDDSPESAVLTVDVGDTKRIDRLYLK